MELDGFGYAQTCGVHDFEQGFVAQAVRRVGIGRGEQVSICASVISVGSFCVCFGALRKRVGLSVRRSVSSSQAYRRLQADKARACELCFSSAT